jgi:hypothetical protein
MRTVILGDSNPNYMFIGQTDMDDGEVKSYMEKGWGVELKNARIFQHQIMTVMTQQGPNTMASTKIYPFPLTNSGASITIKPTLYISVEDIPEISANLKQVMEACLELEQHLRVQQSGLVMARELPKI